ncbi:LAFE_0B08966g1_1 [Lachancea fermentati]|uniref:LAFE_0B08966g1_1 n=1 Tax=Lachancea fermentati TaxID=4955 RepID=A0A1G4M8H5_LACFM|nr:LAFE_0B08966g1_1 [Lachancea fermentati]
MSSNTNDIPGNFKSTLPPRKRAKTKEEKEQRRIERILRNRRAAHQSREKKRLHLQFLEKKATILERIISRIGIEEIANRDEGLRNMYGEYQSLVSEFDPQASPASPSSPPSKKCGAATDISSVGASTSSVPNSAMSTPPSLVPGSPLSQQELETEAGADVSLGPEFIPVTALKQVDFDTSFDSGVPGADNWNLLLTNDNDYQVYSNEDESPIMEMTDNSWALDHTRNPAVITVI